KLGISTTPDNQEYLSELGMEILESVINTVKVEHPLNKNLNKISHVLFLNESNNDGVDTKNVAVFGNQQVARSACGTVLSAQMAIQSSKGLLVENQQFATESIIETPFFGRILEKTTVGKFPAIVPEINGNAFITGKHEFILHPNDELNHGFLLNKDN